MPPADGPRATPRSRPGSTRRDPLVLIALALVLLGLRVSLGLRQPAPPPGARVQGALRFQAGEVMRWRAPDVALEEARETGKPLLYDFTADWCPPCRLMNEQLFDDRELAADLDKRFVPVRVLDRVRETGRNAPWVDELQRRYHVSAFPTLIVVRADGTDPYRIEGYLGRDAVLSQLSLGEVQARRAPAASAAPAAPDSGR